MVGKLHSRPNQNKHCWGGASPWSGTHPLKSLLPKWQCQDATTLLQPGVPAPCLLGVSSTAQNQQMVRKVGAALLFLRNTTVDKDLVYLWRQRRRNLIIFRAAWSCFLVSKLLLKKPEQDHHEKGPRKLTVQTLNRSDLQLEETFS